MLHREELILLRPMAVMAHHLLPPDMEHPPQVMVHLPPQDMDRPPLATPHPLTVDMLLLHLSSHMAHILNPVTTLNLGTAPRLPNMAMAHLRSKHHPWVERRRGDRPSI